MIPIETHLETRRVWSNGNRKVAAAQRAIDRRMWALHDYANDPEAPRSPAQLRQLRLDAEAFALAGWGWFYLHSDRPGNFQYAAVANHLRQRPEAFTRADLQGA